ncbi:hypothetical protein ACH47X_07970 [Promicromonospora kroppenstedtii]|uniref:AmmeMemoRadiSam system protein B n=1 Tax=Promicromonospora kroppenstedtii TaxID=440482 RepID=A0ABW7XI12_9MICO
MSSLLDLPPAAVPFMVNLAFERFQGQELPLRHKTAIFVVIGHPGANIGHLN